MAGVAEAAASGTEFASVLAGATDTISQNQEITFTRYIRTILPLDGFAFWVRSDLLSPSALLNAMLLNEVTPNQPETLVTAANTVTAKGSLHYTTDNQQDETVGYAVHRVIFTSEVDVDELTESNPTTLYIAEIDGIRFSFSRRVMFYRQSGLFHYQGDAIYPAMATQIIDFPGALDLSSVVVSNSLPIWLTLNKFCPMFPSFLVPDNITPPWCAVHIDPASTTALQASPRFDPTTGSRHQLVTEKVRLTLYGLRNFNALDFVDYVQDYAVNSDDLGIMNMPVPKDGKATQAELNILAQMKTIDFEVNYYQSRVRDIALQTIRSAFITILPE